MCVCYDDDVVVHSGGYTHRILLQCCFYSGEGAHVQVQVQVADSNNRTPHEFSTKK